MGALAWYYGPTETDPDPGKAWHYGCGGEVWFLDHGVLCRLCGEQFDDPLEWDDGDWEEAD